MKENAEPIVIRETDYRKLMEPYYEEALRELKNLVAIPSVLDEEHATKEMPFGPEVDKALSYVAELGKRLGFTVSRCDNYVTELCYGEGEKVFDIYAHVDVVPVEKEKWTHDPFELVIEEGNIMYGRGTSDDKGPGIACLYAVKALMDQHRLGGYKLRFLFGGNEETGSLCLEHYFHTMKKEFPTYGISPDAEYPLIYAEKSIYAYEEDFEVSIPEVESFSFGNALNIVLAEASCKVNRKEEEMKAALASYLASHQEVKGEVNGQTITFFGKPYHGSEPWKGVNAGLHLIAFLGTFLHNEELMRIAHLYEGGKGDNFSGNYHDEHFSETSYNVGKMEYRSGVLSLFVNLRFPAGLQADDILRNVQEKTGGKVIKIGGGEGFVSNPESDFVKVLMKAYQEETGDLTSKPLAIGGGTYARESKNSVAFGAQFINRDYRMHGHDEFFPLSDFYDNMQIYAHAIDLISQLLREEK